MRTAVTRDYGNIKKSSNHKAQAKKKKKEDSSQCAKQCLSKTRLCCVNGITHQARERFPISRRFLHVISSPGQPVIPSVSHTPAVHPHHCVCARAPVYDKHKDDCHPQSCVWVKKIYIFREVCIRCISFGRNPRKQPATERSVMKNKKNTYLMCQRGTVDPTPGK